MPELRALDPLSLNVGYRLAALPLCVLLASAPSVEASANPLGSMLAGPGAQIAITTSGSIGARPLGVTNTQMQAGAPNTVMPQASLVHENDTYSVGFKGGLIYQTPDVDYRGVTFREGSDPLRDKPPAVQGDRDPSLNGP